MNTDLMGAAKCYLAAIGTEMVGIVAVCHFPHPKVKNFMRGHRTVVLPDYQRLGIGHRLICEVAQHYVNKGYRFISTTSQPMVYAKRRSDPRWIVTRKGHVSGGMETSKVKGPSLSVNRITVGYEFVGKGPSVLD